MKPTPILGALARPSAVGVVLGASLCLAVAGHAQVADRAPGVVTDRIVVPAAAARGPGPASKTVEIPLHMAHRFVLPAPVRDVIVSNPEIADVIVKTPNHVYVVAKKVGDTNVFFIGKTGDVIMNLTVRVDIEVSGALAAIQALLPKSNIALKGVNGTIVLDGTVHSAKASVDAAAIARRFVSKDTEVINMLRILAEQQVLLKMRFAEIQRNVLKTLGASTAFSTTQAGRTFTLDTFGSTALSITDSRFATAVIPIGKLGITSTTFNTLERRGLVKTLAEPALMAISGETANFLAGGEFPIPAGRDQDGNVTIVFKKFGVSLSFTPVVLADQQISLRIKTEVSRTTTENEQIIDGQTIPGLSVRRAESTVTLSSGGSMMIAGLLQSDELNRIDGVPGLKDLPIIGALFRSESFQNDQTELVILITAFLVRPVEPGLALAAPTDGFVSASDFDIYLLGRLYKRYSKRKPPPEVLLPKGPVGHIME